MKLKGVTLMEIIVSIFIISLIAAAVLTTFPALFEGMSVSSQKVKAWEVAKREMEALKNTSDFTLLFNQAYDPGASQNPIAYSFTTTDLLPQSSGVYYIEKMRDANNQVLSDLLKVEVVVCFAAGKRIIGEDTNLNGVLDSGVDSNEDLNDDKKIGSPIDLVTLIKRI